MSSFLSVSVRYGPEFMHLIWGMLKLSKISLKAMVFKNHGHKWSAKPFGTKKLQRGL
jgi:hypothetical protein